jgi:phosphotransferase system enzyme I (PtsP)
MHEHVEPQLRLDRIVTMIAQNMVAEVCSVYLRQRENFLELFATEGLNREAVHETRLNVGEGLVGHIAREARPLNLEDAPLHPSFAYRPETGEDPFHSFLGVPILRAGQILGVLVVQNETRRHYVEEEVEALQTIALVLAEMLASGDLIDVSEIDEALDLLKQTWRLQGLPLADGIAMGHVVLHEPRVEVTESIADDPTIEKQRLTKAIAELRRWVDDTMKRSELLDTGEHRDVLEAYRMFAHDRGWLRRLLEAVDTGLTADAAVERVQNDTRARMLRQTDPYWRERLHDLDDLSNRLMRHLAGKAGTAASEDLPHDSIVCARTMGPAELLDYDRAKLRGLAIEEGGATSHVAIVARALDIPLVGRVGGLLDRIDSGHDIIADGDSGEVYIRPQSDVISAYAEKVRFRATRQAQYAAIKDEPAVTQDGVEITLNINAGLSVDLPHLDQAGAAGIGLFRTELQFMISSTFPRLGVQTELYRSVLDAAGGRKVVFRTLDLGGDKVLPYLTHEREENPAMGWRAIRFALDRPALLRYQIRALLNASEGRDLDIMFPMIADVSEFKAARALVQKEIERRNRLERAGPANLRIGTMLEVPALAWQLEALCEYVDFVSVGSNDLLQFFFASDRGHPRLTGRYDELSPAVLSFLRQLVSTCDANDVPISLCGEIAGRPLDAMALIGIGFRTISMPPASVGPVKMMVRSLNAASLAAYIKTLYSTPEASVREALRTFAQDNGVTI